jgi:hypothetical protein
MIEIKINKNDLEELFKNNSLTIDNLNIKLSCKEEKKFDYREIKTFENACKKLSLNPNDIVRLFDNFPSKHKKHLIAEYKLVLIFEAINDGWEADYSNENEYKYYPYFIWDKSSGFSFGASAYRHSDSGVSSLLSTNTREKSEYIGEQFIDIYDDFLNN